MQRWSLTTAAHRGGGDATWTSCQQGLRLVQHVRQQSGGVFHVGALGYAEVLLRQHRATLLDVMVQALQGAPSASVSQPFDRTTCAEEMRASAGPKSSCGEAAARRCEPLHERAQPAAEGCGGVRKDQLRRGVRPAAAQCAQPPEQPWVFRC